MNAKRRHLILAGGLTVVGLILILAVGSTPAQSMMDTGSETWLYLPLMQRSGPDVEPLPEQCYTTTPDNARTHCRLALDTVYQIAFPAWERTRVIAGFAIEEGIHAVVDAHTDPRMDVDLKFWGENGQGINVDGPFHPAGPGEVIDVIWHPEPPYVTPGVYLVDLYSYDTVSGTVHFTVSEAGP
jgi:hypothetical protein